MLTIRKDQAAAFARDAERNFDQRLQVALTDRYPHFLPRFSPAARKTITGNMLGRARARGLTWESALVRFTELMIAVAPNFDEHPRISAVLAGARPNVDRALLTLTQRVGDEAWELAAAEAHDLPFFLSPEEMLLPPMERNHRAVTLALQDSGARPNVKALVPEATAMAEAAGWSKVPDAVLTMAVGLALFGPAMKDARANPWVGDIFERTPDPRAAVAMLKFRIALDHGRFV